MLLEPPRQRPDNPRMAHVPLAPIGRARDAFLDAATFEKNRAAMRAKDDELSARRHHLTRILLRELEYGVDEVSVVRLNLAFLGRLLDEQPDLFGRVDSFFGSGVLLAERA